MHDSDEDSRDPVKAERAALGTALAALLEQRVAEFAAMLDRVGPDGVVVIGPATKEVLRLRPRMPEDEARTVAQDAITLALEHWRAGSSLETYLIAPPGKRGALEYSLLTYREKRATDPDTMLDIETDDGEAAHESIASPAAATVRTIPHPWSDYPDLPVVPEWRDGPRGPMEVHAVEVSPEALVKQYFDQMGDLTRLEFETLRLVDSGLTVTAIADLQGVTRQNVQNILRTARKKRPARPKVRQRPLAKLKAMAATAEYNPAEAAIAQAMLDAMPAALVDAPPPVQPHAWVDATQAPQWWFDGFESDPALMRPRDRRRAIAARDAAMKAASGG